MNGELFIALQVEELPAQFVKIAEDGLREGIQSILKNIPFESVQSWSTPRHIAISIPDLAEHSPMNEKVVTGPPWDRAFKNGEPTKVALGFARGKKVRVDELEKVESKRGPVVAVRVKTGGESATKTIQSHLEQIVSGIAFPKTMRWGSGAYSWARPVHKLIVTYKGEIVPCSVFGIEASNTASGHRLSPQEFTANHSQEWLSALRANFVEPNPSKRKEQIRTQLLEKAEHLGASIQDMDLLEEVYNLVEYPVTIVGAFPKELLELPSKLLVEAMKLHQRVFPLYKDGSLTSSFLAVTNQPFANDPEVSSIIAEGNKRVLTARFYDAKFFYAEDRKKPLREHGLKLSKMQWIRNAGTMQDKAQRVAALAQTWAPLFHANPEHAHRAASLCKNDLCTQMVIEFPKLQGHVGKLLARLDDEAEDIPLAIEEHYYPRFSGDQTASTALGKCIAAADRWDTLSNCFALKLQPKGSGDPLGLRRAAHGFLHTIMAAQVHFEIEALCAEQENSDALLRFMRARLKTYFQEQAPNDIVNAVMAAPGSNPLVLQSKLSAMVELSKSEHYRSLRGVFKRVMGLSKDHQNARYSVALFQDPSEHQLHEHLQSAQQKAEQADNHTEALQSLVAIKPSLESFFDSVMVMAKEEPVRMNRLSLLRNIAQSFYQIADFSLLSTD